MESKPAAVQHMCSHVLNQLSYHRSKSVAQPTTPLFVGVQGPQGSGKTYLTSLLRECLAGEPHNLSVAVLSLDDLYLTHDGLVALASAHPDNVLLRGRGQPGTHDVGLGMELLKKLKRINEEPGAEVEIPSFDKSLYNGEGDRTPHGAFVRSPVDVVVLEGWCVGFYPVPTSEIDRRWEQPVQGLALDFFQNRGIKKDDVLDVNERLTSYIPLWESLETFIQIKPEEGHPYTYIYKWRLQQEHNMKARNGGKGMSDTQVEAFVDRYIPGYVFFGDGVTKGYSGIDNMPPPWIGRGLAVEIGEDRQVVAVKQF